MYFNSVGHNSRLIVGLTPDNRGLMPKPDSKRCKAWGDSIRRLFSNRVGHLSGQGDEVSLTLPEPAEFDHIVLQEDICEIR